MNMTNQQWHRDTQSNTMSSRVTSKYTAIKKKLEIPRHSVPTENANARVFFVAHV